MSNPNDPVKKCTKCAPKWYTKGKHFRRKTDYTAEELNLIARVVYGEATGSNETAEARASPEKIAEERRTVAGVIFNRANANPDDDVNDVITKENQFPSVTNDEQNGKFLSAAPDKAGELTPAECADLQKALAAVQAVIDSNHCSGYGSFQKYDPKGNPGSGEKIGGTWFYNK